MSYGPPSGYPPSFQSLLIQTFISHVGHLRNCSGFFRCLYWFLSVYWKHTGFFFHLKKFLISFEAIKVLKSNLQVSLWLIAPLVFYTQLHPTLFSDWTLLYPSLLCLYLNTQPQSAFLSMEFVLFSLWLVSFHSNPISLFFLNGFSPHLFPVPGISLCFLCMRFSWIFLVMNPIDHLSF